MQEHFAHCGLVCIVMLVTGGCSNGNQTPVRGTVRVEGQVVSEGRVVFAPVGGGLPATGAIRPDGTFKLVLEAVGDAKIASCYVSVSSACVAGMGGKSVLCIAPRERPMSVMQGRENELNIVVNQSAGWKVVFDD